MIPRWLVVASVVTIFGACSTPRATDPPTESAEASTISAVEVERSDRFWEAYSNFAPTNYRYDSLEQITRDVDLIIRGRLVGTRDGELQPFAVDIPGARPVTFGVVAIDEVLKGSPNVLVPGAVLVSRLGEKNQPRAELPNGEVILFLMNYAVMRAEAGDPPSDGAADRFYYARPNGYQAVLRNMDGVVRIVRGPEGWEAALGPFPAPMDGRPFGDLVETIRQLVGEARDAPTATT